MRERKNGDEFQRRTFSVRGHSHGYALVFGVSAEHPPLSWRLDETYIKVKGEWVYFYRAVDKFGKTIDFLLTRQRDKKAARRFLNKAISRHGVPEKITIDGSDANASAIKSYNEDYGTSIEIRQIKYLNNIVEQDHRGVKRVTRPMLGFKAFNAAQNTLTGSS